MEHRRVEWMPACIGSTVQSSSAETSPMTALRNECSVRFIFFVTMLVPLLIKVDRSSQGNRTRVKQILELSYLQIGRALPDLGRISGRWVDGRISRSDGGQTFDASFNSMSGGSRGDMMPKGWRRRCRLSRRWQLLYTGMPHYTNRERIRIVHMSVALGTFRLLVRGDGNPECDSRL